MKNLDEKKISSHVKKNYLLENNTFKQTVRSDQSELTEVEIGDAKQKDFLPQIKLKKWDNEANVSIRLIDDDPAVAEITTEEEKILWSKSGKEARFYKKQIDLEQEAYDEKWEYPQITQPILFKKLPYPHLIEGNYIWGRDDENERAIRKQKATEAYGNVLIVGLGLGVINEYLKQNSNVKSITVVEFSQDVIDIVKKEYPERLDGVRLIKADFYEYAQTTEDRFDYVFGDIFTDVRKQYLHQWEKFLQVAQTIGNTIDGRIKQHYDNFKNRIPNIENEAIEFDIIVKSKPKDNRIDFSLQHKEVDFFYQPELNEKQLGRGDYRPPSVVGSYAIYHKEKTGDYSKLGGKNYRGGKVGHIYRPIITDAEGKTTYGDLELKEEKLTVIIPQEFLDKAVYPVIVDPTIGYGTPGGTSTGSYGSDRIEGSLFTGLAGTGVSISAYINKDNGVAAKAVIFTHSTLAPLTNGTTSEKTTAKLNGWETYIFGTAPTLTAVDYLVSWYADGVGKGTLNEFFYDTGASNQGHDQTSGSLTYPTVPNPLSGYSHSTNKYSIYVTYYAASSGPLSPGTMANVSRSGVVWADPDNAKVSDNSYATLGDEFATLSDLLKASNFGFSIPTDSTINGIVVEIEKQQSYSDVYDDDVFIVKGGTIGTSNRESAVKWPTTDAYTTYGNTEDLWGETWTPADINNSGFGVVIGAREEYEGSPVNLYLPSIDHIRITVYYTPPASSTANSERSATIRGKDTANSTRSATMRGKTTANSTRSATMRGKTTSNSERPATIKGKQTANSDRSAKTSGKSTANSERLAKTTGKDSSQSERQGHLLGQGIGIDERQLKITGEAGDVYSKQAKVALPSNDANLEPIYSDQEVIDVSTDDDVFVDLDVAISGYAIHQFKKLNSNNTDKIDITLKARSSVAPSVQNVLLQIFNRVSGLWETLDTESSAGVAEEFTLIGSLTTGLSDYYDINNVISVRVYQQIT